MSVVSKNNNYIMQNVETIVCDCVNEIMEEDGRKPVSPGEIYLGKKNIPYARILARSFTFDVLHNKFGFSYAVIAQRADMVRNSVIMCISKCHQLQMFDKTYKKVNDVINAKLEEIYG